jgi:long-subunit fatty acid transport protein
MNSLLVTTTFQNNNFSYDEYRLGLEYGYNDLFFVRSGYAFAPQSTSENYMYGFTAGAGVNYQVQGFAFKIDYAYRDVQYFDANHIITLTMGF